MQEVRDTYWGKILQKHADELFKRIEEEPGAPRGTDALSQYLELVFVQAVIECVNDLDSRLRKLEARAPKYHD